MILDGFSVCDKDLCIHAFLTWNDDDGVGGQWNSHCRPGLFAVFFSLLCI